MTIPIEANQDKTNFVQSLMHMVKGNLGTGILAMPASFAHTGLFSALIGLPILCIIATYCVHLLIRSTIILQHRQKVSRDSLCYANLAKESFLSGPRWMRSSASAASMLVDGILLVAQFGVCCVYIVFVVDNISKILSTYKIKVSTTIIYMIVYPVTLSLSCIRTLKRLAIASACANLLQVIGIACVLEYLLRDINKLDLSKRDKFRPLEDTALGFGSAMFAFEGISVVLPIYLRMRNQNQMSGVLGLINVSYGILLILYFCVGLFGYLRFGNDTEDSITLNLPPEPLYDVVRAMFATSVLLTYPLQFYVPNEIVWNWVRRTLLVVDSTENVSSTVINIEAIQHSGELDHGSNQQDSVDQKHSNQSKLSVAQEGKNSKHNNEKTNNKEQCPNDVINHKLSEIQTTKTTQQRNLKTFDALSDVAQFESPNSLKVVSYESDTIVFEGANPRFVVDSDLTVQDYFCRTVLVSLTFILARSVPKLNLLMDFIGSVTGTSLSLIIPSLIHIGAFWNDTRGLDKFSLISLDMTIIVFGIVAGVSGSVSSLRQIISSFNKPH